MCFLQKLSIYCRVFSFYINSKHIELSIWSRWSISLLCIVMFFLFWENKRRNSPNKEKKKQNITDTWLLIVLRNFPFSCIERVARTAATNTTTFVYECSSLTNFQVSSRFCFSSSFSFCVLLWLSAFLFYSPRSNIKT